MQIDTGFTTLVALLGLFATGPASAASESGASRTSGETPRGRAPAPDTPPSTSREAQAELVAELLGAQDAEDDLSWLYSNADEYRPARSTGPAIPAPDLPGPGRGSPRRWNPSWRKFGWGHGALVATSFVGAGAFLLVAPAPERWTRNSSLDEWGREHLGYASYDDGRWAQDTSDVLLSVNLAFPLLVDSLIVADWFRESPELARQLAFITLESLAVTTFLQVSTSVLTSRERPYGRDCGSKLPDELDHCEEPRRYRSFFSGHTAIGFAMAATTCSHHLRHDLFGSPAADAATCAIAMTSAATVGTMRVVGGQHYITDVLGGALLGTLSGLGVPWLLHYKPSAATNTIDVSVIPSARGLTLGGTF